MVIEGVTINMYYVFMAIATFCLMLGWILRGKMGKG